MRQAVVSIRRGKIEYFGELNDLITRAQKGSTLSCAELLSANALLRSARVAYENIAKIDDAEIVLMRDMAEKLYFDKKFGTRHYRKNNFGRGTQRLRKRQTVYNPHQNKKSE